MKPERAYLLTRLAIMARRFLDCPHSCGELCRGWADRQDLRKLLAALEATK